MASIKKKPRASRRRAAAKKIGSRRRGPRTLLDAVYFDGQRQAASILGIDEYDLKEWKAQGCPAFRDTRVYRVELLRWMQQNGKAAPAGPPPAGASKGKITVRDFKAYESELRCSKMEREIARGDGLLLVATDLEVPIGAMLAAIQTKLSQFPSRVARFMLQLRDEASAEERLRDEMDAVLIDLNLAGFLDGAADDVANAFPFDDETRDLQARLNSADQGTPLFAELVAALVRGSITEGLRRIGSRALRRRIEPEEEASSPESGDDSV